MTTYTLDEVQDKLIGSVGTPNRDRFEYELQMDLKGKALYPLSIFPKKFEFKAKNTYFCQKFDKK